MKLIAQALGLDENISESLALDKIKAIQVTAEKAKKELEEALGKVDAMQADIKAKHDAEAALIVAEANKINEDVGRSIKVLADVNLEEARTLLAQLSSKPANNVRRLSAETNVSVTTAGDSRENWTRKDWFEKDQEGLKQIKAQDASRYRKIMAKK